MLTIFIKNEGIELDMNQDQPMSVNLNFNETDLALRKSSYTRTIALPKTKTNDAFFKKFYRLDISEEYIFDTKKALPCILYDDNYTIIEGILQLKDVTNVNGLIKYNCVIFDSLKRLYVELGDDKLEDLDLTSYNHDRSIEVITRSYSNEVNYGNGFEFAELGEGYRYPHIFMQDINDTTKLLGNKQLPALFYKTYIDEIFQSKGFSYTSEFLNSDDFKSIIIPSDKSGIKFDPLEVNDNTVVNRVDTNTQGTEGSTGATTYSTKTDSGIRAIDFERVIEGNESLMSPGGRAFTVVKSGEYDINTVFTGFVRLNPSTSDDVLCLGVNVSVKLELWKQDINNNRTVIKSVTQMFINSEEITIDDPDNYDSSTLAVSAAHSTELKAGDVLYNTVKILRGGDYCRKKGAGLNRERTLKMELFYTADTNGGQLSEFAVKLASGGEEPTNVRLDFSRVVPDIKQKDLISDVIKQFNLRVIPDPASNTSFIIEPYDALYLTNTRRIKDWSTLIDRSKEIKIKESPFDYKYFSMTYDEDNAYFGEYYADKYGATFGDLSLTFDNDFTDKRDEFKSLFTSTPSSSAFSDRIMPYNIKIDEEGNYTAEGGKLRQLFWPTKLTNCNPYEFFEDVESLETDFGGFTMTEYPNNNYLGSNTGRSFDLIFYSTYETYQPVPVASNNNIYNKFHSNYVNQLSDPQSRLVEAFVHLNSKEINDLDRTDRIFIDGQYYIIQRIQGWDKNQASCKVILLMEFPMTTFAPSEFDSRDAATCPLDITTKKIRFGLGVEYYSPSGQAVTKGCCDSIDGATFSDAAGKCRKLNPIVEPNPGPTPRGPWGTPRKGDGVWDWGYRDNAGGRNGRGYGTNFYQGSTYSYTTSTSNNFNPASLFSSSTDIAPDANHSRSWGYNNNLGGKNSYVFGNNSQANSSNVFIVGDNVVSNGPGIYFGDNKFNEETGKFEKSALKVVLIWDGGNNVSYDVLKTNDEDILYNGQNAVFNQSDVDRDGANIYSGQAPFEE